MTETAPIAQQQSRPAGTAALMWGVVGLPLGLLLWVIGGLAWQPLALGGFLTTVVAFVALIVGAVQRLAGGAPKPVSVRKVLGAVAATVIGGTLIGLLLTL